MSRTKILGLLAGTILAMTGCERRETRIERTADDRADESATVDNTAPDRDVIDQRGRLDTADERGLTADERDDVQPVAGREDQEIKDLSDANILAILVSTNQHEIDVAQLVLGKTKNGDVKSFAQHMVKGHSDGLKKVMDLAGRLDIKPESNDKLDEMKKKKTEAIDKLSKLSASDLDKAYMVKAIEDHRKMLEKIDTKLLPAADAPELRDLLTAMKGNVEKHLEMAGKIDLAKSSKTKASDTKSETKSY